MKQSNTCPKCSSHDIIRIEGFRGSGNYIPTGIFSAVLVARYVCAHCGYSEEWVDNPEDIKKIKRTFGKSSR